MRLGSSSLHLVNPPPCNFRPLPLWPAKIATTPAKTAVPKSSPKEGELERRPHGIRSLKIHANIENRVNHEIRKTRNRSIFPRIAFAYFAYFVVKKTLRRGLGATFAG